MLKLTFRLFFIFTQLVTLVFNSEVSTDINKCSEILVNYKIPLETKDYIIEAYEISSFLPKEYQSISSFNELFLKYISSHDSKKLLLKDFTFTDNNVSCSISINLKLPLVNLRRSLFSTTLKCDLTSYYSALFAMDLPTGSNLTVNVNNSACNCLGSLVNSSTLENKIFCKCPNGELLKSDGLTCISLKECNEESKIVIDNFCVDCVTGSSFNAVTNKCVCTTGIWRPNYCNLTGESQTPKRSGFMYNSDPMCAKNDLVHIITYDSLTDPIIIKNLLLSPDMTIFVASCNMVGTASITLTINGIPANYISNFDFNIGCSGANLTKYLAFHPSHSNIYSLEITCSVSPCNGSIILLTELKSVTFMSLNSNLSLTNAANALQNTFDLGLTTSENNIGLLWNMKKGDIIVILLTKFSGLTATLVVRIGNLLQTLPDTVVNVTTVGYYYYNIPQDDDYYIKFGCLTSANCKGNLQLTVQKTNNGFSHYWEKEVSFTYSISSTNTENATVNTKNIGCVSSSELAEFEYLVKNLYRGDYIEIILPNADTYVAIINTDLNNLNLEVQPQSVSGSYVFSKSIIAQGSHCLKFGCKETTASCSGTVILKIRKTVTTYLEGSYKAFSDTFTAEAILGEVGNDQYDNLKNLKTFDNMYVETLPSNYINYADTTSISIEGAATFENYSGLFNYSKLYFPLKNSGSYIINMVCIDDCTSKYVYSIFTFPMIAGYESGISDCGSCLDSSISVSNVCKACNTLVSPINGFIYSLSTRKYMKGNDCSDYPLKYIYFNKAGKYYECKPGFTPNVSANPNACECKTTIVNGECIDPAYCTSDNGATRLTSATFLKNSSGMCECSDTTKCYDSTADYICISGAIGKINNSDGRSCSSYCKSSSKCYDPITYICTNKIVNSLEFYKSPTTGGVCIPNTCTMISTGAILVLTTHPLVSRVFDGSCLCNDINSCLDPITHTCIVRTVDYIVGPECLTIACSKPNATILVNDNNLKMAMSVPTGTNILKVDFTDPNNILSGVDFDRYYMQVQFTDPYAVMLISGDKSNTNSASITLTEAQINQFCALVDEAEVAKGRKCYFRAIIADKCIDTLDHVVYNHFAMRIINADSEGIYIFGDLSVAQDNLLVDYCRWIPECYLSTRYKYLLKLCEDNALVCVEVDPEYKYKRDEAVFIQISFFDLEDTELVGKEFSIISVMTKLYTNLNQEINTPERTVILVNQPNSVDNKIYFNFNLTPDLLFYDNETLISSNVRLLIVVKVENEAILRYLQINLAKNEIIPKIGGLVAINIDYEDVLNYQKSSNRKIMIMIVLVSVFGSLTVILLTVIGFLFFTGKLNNKKEKKAEAADPQTVTRLSTQCKNSEMGFKINFESGSVSNN